MAPAVKPIPEGRSAITPHLVVKGAAEAIEFYKKAFGAEQVDCSLMPDGRVMHAELKIGDAILYLADEFPESGCGGPSPLGLGGSPVRLHLYVADIDSAFPQAVAAGAEVQMPVMDMFWGDRYGQLRDPFGHLWSLATRKEDLTREQMKQRAQEFFSSMGRPAMAGAGAE